MANVPYQGEIWSARLPNKPDDPHQPRPVLIVSSDEINVRGKIVLVVPIFSRGQLGPLRVPLPHGEGGIGHDSVLFCDQVTCLDTKLLESDSAFGTSVSEEILDEVILGIQAAVGLDIPYP